MEEEGSQKKGGMKWMTVLFEGLSELNRRGGG